MLRGLSRPIPVRLSGLLNSVRTFKIGKSPRRDEIFLVPIEGLNKHGYGITRIEWGTIQKQIEPTDLVVRSALPGETVRVRVVSVYSSGGSAIHTVRLNVFGRRENLIRPRKDNEPWRSTIEPDLLPPGHEESEDFQPFDCPHFDRRHDEQACRGCSVPHLNYTRQIIEKTKLLKASLRGAVEDELLASLTVEPRSMIQRFSDKTEIFAFSKKPLEVPIWGQLSHKDPLPGERRNKHFVATPECKIMSKSAQAVIRRLGQLIEAKHAQSPSLFSVHDEFINRGYLRSAIVQSGRGKDGKIQVLLSIVTATEPSPRFRQVMQEEIADRLMHEFPEILKGVLLLEGKITTDRDHEMFKDESKRQLLGGEPKLNLYLDSIDREISVGPDTQIPDTEVTSKLLGTLSDVLGSYDSPILELYSGDGSVTPILKQISADVQSLGSGEMKLMLEEGISPPAVSDSHILLPKMNAVDEPLDKAPIVRNEEAMGPVLDNSRPFTAVVSFPPTDNGKAEVKGVTPKAFRHWLGNVVRPKRIVMMTEKFDGLRKDIGHMKLLGYELKSIRAFDAQPGVMDRIATIVVLEKKPGYKPLSENQLLE
jgi:tRNA/tmRNA/rRNA uracil-C5-methylase (TrmA/RlmC/RlmD family)